MELQAAGEVIRSLWRETEDQWIYRCVLDQYTGKPILRVAGTDKVVATLHRTQSNGLFVLLPELWLTDDDDDEDEDEKAADANTGSSEIAEEEPRESPDALLSWLTSLSTVDEEPPADWLSRFRFPDEAVRLAQLASLESTLAKLLGSIEDARASLSVDAQWKRLVSAQGTTLELQVEQAFRVIGFSIEDRRPGRSDLRITYGDRHGVVEIKGVTKSAAERHAAQLEKWVAEEVQEGRAAKGILVVNTWRHVPLDQRLEASFPPQMLPYSEARGHSLLTGAQLLSMVRACIADESRKDKVAAEILDAVGVVRGWSDLDDVFERPALTASESDVDKAVE